MRNAFESFRTALIKRIATGPFRESGGLRAPTLTMRKLFFLPWLTIALTSAQDNAPQQLVDKAIERAGGWDAWMATKTVQFRRTEKSFDPEGKVTETHVQFHKYILQPWPQMRIEWESNGSKGVVINNGHEAWKLVNGKPATSQEDIMAARSDTFAPHYLFAMPFKLRDRGTQLEDAGTMTTDDGTVVRKIRAVYAKGVGDSGGMHKWTYMIDPQNGRLVCNHLGYMPGKYVWGEYYDEKRVGPLLLPTRMVGYEADANGKVGSKQSEMTYDQIETNVEFRRDLFKPPL